MTPDPTVPVRRPRRWVLGTVVLAVVGAVAGTAAVLTTRHPAPVVADGGRQGSPAPSATAGAPGNPAQAEIDATLRAMERALVGGDRGAWLAPIGPEAGPKVRKLYGNMYDNLRALRVTEVRLIGRVGNSDPDTINVNLVATVCFGRPPCTNEQRSVTSKSRVVMQELESVGTLQVWKRGAYRQLKLSYQTDTDGALPWFTSSGPKLTGVTEGRITVAGPESVRSKLRGWLPIAREAVQRAEKFQIRGDKPVRYLIYLADAQAWQQWFDYTPAAWVAGFYPGMSSVTTRSVVIRDDSDNSPLVNKFLLRHELGHAVTLDEPGESNNQYWWLTEGIAEYVAFSDYGADFYFGADLRSWFRRHKPTGIGPLEGPAKNTGPEQVNRMYALAYASVDCLAHQYGEKSMKGFFDARVLDQVTADEASRQYFRKPWAQVSKGCAAHMQSIAR